MTDTDQHGNPLPAYLLPARQHERGFTLADLNVCRDMGTARTKALVAIIDGLTAALPPTSP